MLFVNVVWCCLSKEVGNVACQRRLVMLFVKGGW